MTPRTPFGMERGGKERKGRGRAPIRLLAQGPPTCKSGPEYTMTMRYTNLRFIIIIIIIVSYRIVSYCSVNTLSSVISLNVDWFLKICALPIESSKFVILIY